MKKSGLTYVFVGLAAVVSASLLLARDSAPAAAAVRGVATKGITAAMTARAKPAVPGNLQAVPISTAQVSLSWTAVKGAGSYQVWRSIQTSTSYRKIATVKSAQYLSHGLKASTRYNYKVRAVAGKVTGRYSSVSSAYTAIPAGLTATTASASQINLSWSPIAGATSYQVWRSAGASAPFVDIANVSAGSYQNTGLTAATTYSYKVRAALGAALTGYSVVKTGSTGATGPVPPVLPAAPTGVAASLTSATQITVGWNAVAGATAYKVYLSTNGAAFAYKATVTAPTVTYADIGLFAGTYSYKVSAVAGSAEGPQSSATTTITLAPSSALPAPGNFSAATYNYQSVQLYYDVVQNAATYRIYYSKVPSANIADYASFDWAAKDCRVIGMDAGTPYYFRVAGVDSGGKAGTPTGFVAATTSAPPGNPPQPAFYLYSIGTAGSKYEMNFYRCTSPIYYTEMDPAFSFYAGTSSSNMTLVSTADLSQYFYFDITPGQSLWYGFTANWGPYASTMQTIQVAALGQPTGVAANGMTGDHLVHMSWNAVPYASRYNIYYSVGVPYSGQSWFAFRASTLGSTLHYYGYASGTTAMLSGFPDFSTYYFIVVPTDASGVEGWYCGYANTTVFW